MNEGWYAFALALMYRDYIIPETAFEYLALGRGRQHKFATNRSIAESDVQDMVKMRLEGKMTWSAIGSLYGLSSFAARRRILRYEDKVMA